MSSERVHASQMSYFPVDPEMARMIIVASALGCAEQVLVIAAVLSGDKDLLLELVRLRLRRCFEPMCCVRRSVRAKPQILICT